MNGSKAERGIQNSREVNKLFLQFIRKSKNTELRDRGSSAQRKERFDVTLKKIRNVIFYQETGAGR